MDGQAVTQQPTSEDMERARAMFMALRDPSDILAHCPSLSAAWISRNLTQPALKALPKGKRR